MSATLEVTFKDLAQVALSSTEFTQTQITILHSLVQLLLKKLNCEDDKIILSGHEAHCFKQELDLSKIPVLTFDDNKMTLFQDKFKELDKLEERARSLENKLKDHMLEIEEVKAIDKKELLWENWNIYESWCEDLTTACQPESELACKLLQNADFLNQMCRRISEPIVDRLFELEKKVQLFQEELNNFLKNSAEYYEKIALVQECVFKIDQTNKKLSKHDLEFLATMEELQDMLDCKLDKIHLPVLKKYLQNRFSELEKNLSELLKRQTCPQAAGIIMHGIQCVCCENSQVCARVGVPSTGILPELKRPTPKFKRFCGCPESRHNQASTSKVTQLMTILRSSSESKANNRCKNQKTDVKLLEGNNGLFYRKG